MNPLQHLHPVIVHFPIALLTLYAALEIARLRVLTRQAWYFPMKAILVILGEAGALLAQRLGEVDAESRTRSVMTRAVIEKHELFSDVVVIVFGILAAAYLIVWIGQRWQLPAVVRSYSAYVLKAWSAALLAFVGFLALLVTGALGALIVYGPDRVEPFARFVYRLLVAR